MENKSITKRELLRKLENVGYDAKIFMVDEGSGMKVVAENVQGTSDLGIKQVITTDELSWINR